jgi:hypothetical protein
MVAPAMNIDEINTLCREISEEALNDCINAYCDALDEEYVAMMEASNPRYHGPDYDEGCEFDPMLG